MSKEKEYNIFIGFDERESHVYNLCEFSMRQHSKSKLNIHPLNHKELRDEGFFDRGWRIHGQTGQYVDEREERPFSTQFAFTRFLVPSICKARGIKGNAMFVDCDFIFKDDIAKLFDEVEAQPLAPLYTVHHDYTSKNQVKMDNCEQKNYNRKLWSSLMVFNVNHPYNDDINPSEVNIRSGLWLHNFLWIPRDQPIGEISERWNFIPNHSEPRVNKKDIGAIHYTEGGPWFKGLENCDYSDIYYKTELDYYKHMVKTLKGKKNEN